MHRTGSAVDSEAPRTGKDVRAPRPLGLTKGGGEIRGSVRSSPQTPHQARDRTLSRYPSVSAGADWVRSRSCRRPVRSPAQERRRPGDHPVPSCPCGRVGGSVRQESPASSSPFAAFSTTGTSSSGSSSGLGLLSSGALSCFTRHLPATWPCPRPTRTTPAAHLRGIISVPCRTPLGYRGGPSRTRTPPRPLGPHARRGADGPASRPRRDDVARSLRPDLKESAQWSR